MKKTKEQIEYKWNQVYEAAKKKAEYDRELKIEKARQKCRFNLDKEIASIDRKFNAKLRRKKDDCDKKCKNEIRKLQWKPERQYKKKVTPFKTIEFAMELQQENSKLRDTDADGRGFCCSCDRFGEWWDFAGWHEHSRRIKNICIHPANINAQCHRCNLIMGPLGNVDLKMATETHYRENMIEKWGKETVEYLDQQKALYFQKWYESNWDYGQWKDENWKIIDIEKHIEAMIEENRLRWKAKSFYKPRKDWKKVWDSRKS